MLLNIQILRFIAAMGVVLSHVYIITPAAFNPDWPKLLTYFAAAGFGGVDLFFVISGAVMAESTRALAPGLNTGLRFGATRFARIYIGWWPFFALYLAANLLHGAVIEGVLLPGSFFLLPMRLNQYLVPVTWTLSFELYFYLVIAVLLALLNRSGLRLALWAWGAAIAGFTAYSASVGMYTPARFAEINIWHAFYAYPQVLEFIAGFLLCDHLRSQPKTRWQTAALAAVLLATLAVVYQRRGGLHASGLAGYFHAPERTLLVGGASCGIVACALLWREPVGRLGRTLARLGDASYAIYLSHILVLIVSYTVIQHLGLPTSLKVPLQVLAVWAVVAYSWLHYAWIEHPIYRRARQRIQSAFA